MSARGAVGLAAVALVAAAGLWWWSGRGPSVDPRLERARESGREAKAICDAGRHDEALERYLEAADLAEAAGDAALARGLRAQAAVPLKLAGRLDEARALLLPVLESARADDDRRSEGLALGNLARVEDLAGHPELALSYLDQLAEFGRREGDARLEVWTLEQAAAAAGALGDVPGALARIERALASDDALSDEERRHDALLGQKALLLAQQGDAEGAWTLWSALPVSAASLANRAVSLSRWDLHEQASDIAWSAAQAFGEEGEGRNAQRDQALLLHVSELIANGQADFAADRIDALFEAGGDDPALEAFRVPRARVAIARGQYGAAADELSALLDGPTDRSDEPQLAELTAAALLLDGRAAEALERITPLEDDLARRVLHAWALLGAAPSDALLGEALPGFRAASWSPEDRSLARLRALCPAPLPTPAWLAVEIGLADAGRARAAGNAELAEVLLRDGVREALLWQALDAMSAVPGLVVGAPVRALQERIADAWIEGRLPEDEAVLAYVGGETGSYLLLMRPGQPPTTWSLAPAPVLAGQATRVVESLHAPDLQAIARAAYALYTSLVPRGAREDLDRATHWTMILPPEVGGVPPGMLVTREPEEQAGTDGDTSIAWLVLERSPGLLPHVPGLSGSDVQADGPWLTVGAPAVALDGLPLSSSTWLARYGLNVFNAGAPRAVQDGDVLAGAEATVRAMARTLPGRAGVRFSQPAAGAGQFGGLVFSPDPAAARGDEAGGLLSFSRMAALPLPPLVVLDASRFDPGDPRYGPSWAATAVLTRARALLMTRWPVPVPMRDAIVRQTVEARAGGLSTARALASVQRDYLAAVSASGEAAAMHPQLWAAWMAFGLD